MLSNLEYPMFLWALALVVALSLGTLYIRPAQFVRKGRIVRRNGPLANGTMMPVSLFGYLAAMAIVIGATLPFSDYTQEKRERLETRAVAGIDMSASVVDSGAVSSVLLPEEGLTCANSEIGNVPALKRVFGQCKAIEALLDGLEQSEQTAERSLTNRASLLLFATKALVISPFTSNYESLRKASQFNWLDTPTQSSNTNVNEALVTQLALALDRNHTPGSGFTPLSDVEIESLLAAMNASERRDFDLRTLPASLQEKLPAIAQEMHDTIFLVLTDGQFVMASFDSINPSLRKLLQLLKHLDIAVHFIGIDPTVKVDFEVASAARDSGYGPADSHSRGTFHVANDPKDLPELVEGILAGRALLTKPYTITLKRTYVWAWALFALALFLGYIVLYETTTRSVTE
jgi:hypothetical protein